MEEVGPNDSTATQGGELESGKSRAVLEEVVSNFSGVVAEQSNSNQRSTPSAKLVVYRFEAVQTTESDFTQGSTARGKVRSGGGDDVVSPN